MAITYAKSTLENGAEFIIRTNEDETQSWIPMDESNADYQTYLASLEPVKPAKK